MNADKIVIGLAGMPGAGKSLVVDAAQQEGYAVVVMGDVVRDEVQKRGLELNPKNVGEIMLELRQTGGNGVIAERCIPKILQQKSSKVIVDGIRSLHEIEAFKLHFTKFTLVAVHASPETRFARLTSRRRSDDPTNWELFRERDFRELNVGLGNAIAMADYIVVNENSKERTKDIVKQLLHRIEEKWMK
ncbi:MAG: AAA family ATPase [Candidatus Bathyarchaeia archaeon]